MLNIMIIMTTNLPNHSTGNANGLWLVFDDGINTIRYWSSTFSAKEKLYLNDQLLVNKNNFKFTEQLKFSDRNDNHYEFRIFIKSFTDGEIEADLLRNNQLIKRTIIRGERIGGDRKMNLSKTFLYFAVVISIFTLNRMFNLSLLIFTALVGIAFIVYFRSLDKGQVNYTFDELDI